MAKHPAHFFVKYLLIKDPLSSDAQILKTLEDWSFLSPDQSYLGFMRQKVKVPPGFDPLNKLHRPSVKFLRDENVYELFHKTDAMEVAWAVLVDPTMRLVVEQILLARLDLKSSCQKMNAKHGWKLTVEGLEMFQHYFWNVPHLTFDEWGRFLYGRSAMYERYMGLLTAPPQLAFFHLRLEQALDSKKMIQRTQEIAYFTLEEVAQKPGVSTDKVKAINMLGKTVLDCHAALSTSDMALKDVLQQFEKWRMEHPQSAPPDIKKLAPDGNFSGSGLEEPQKKQELPS